MGRRAKISRDAITASAIHLVVEGGARNTTIKAISARMDVNEAALYRHFKSKEEILSSAYIAIVAEMAEQKRHLAKSTLSFAELVREWIALTYDYFDANPDAFAYVLLVPPSAVAGAEISRVQGKLFLSLLRRALRKGEIAAISPKLAYSHFSGIMLNIPRLIYEGALRGPARAYVDDAAHAVLRALGQNVTPPSRRVRRI
jgi:AcrR family transcriptional regulator